MTLGGKVQSRMSCEYRSTNVCVRLYTFSPSLMQKEAHHAPCCVLLVRLEEDPVFVNKLEKRGVGGTVQWQGHGAEPETEASSVDSLSRVLPTTRSLGPALCPLLKKRQQTQHGISCTEPTSPNPDLITNPTSGSASLRTVI